MKRHSRLQNVALTGLAAFGLALAATVLTSCTPAKEAPPTAAGPAATQGGPQGETARKSIEAKKPDYSPYPDRSVPTRVYWGVAHVHTGYSFDSGMFGVTLTPEDLFKVARGGEVVDGQRPALQAGPAAGLGRHHRPCGVHGHLRSDPRRQPGTPRQSPGQALVRDVQDEPTGGRQGRHRGRRLHADRQAGLRRVEAHGGGLGARRRGRREVQRAGRFHGAARLRVDLGAWRQQPPSHRRLPRQRATAPARSFPSPRSTARTRPTCGSTWTRTRRRRAARCWPSRTTAT